MSTTLKCDNGDLVVSTGGRFVTVTGMEKSAQDIAEALLNTWDSEGSNRFNGSELAFIQGNADIGIVEESIRYAVQSAIERLMDNQSDDPYIDDEEQIEKIAQLHVRKLGLFTYGFYLMCTTVTEEDIPIAFSISLSQQLPSSLDLSSLKTQIMSPDRGLNVL